jgi:O-antigen ligase
MYCWPLLPLIYIEEGESPFIFIHSYHSCVRDVTKRSALVFLFLLDLLLYFISCLGVTRVSQSFLEYLVLGLGFHPLEMWRLEFCDETLGCTC